MTAPRKNRAESRWELFLYVGGKSHAKSATAYSNLKRICEEHLTGDYKLTVIDISESPDSIFPEHILAIPTLVRRTPAPRRLIIGDLEDTDRVLASLGVRASE